MKNGFVIALFFVITATAFATDTAEDRANLKGVKQFKVVIENISNEAINDGLDSGQIKTDVELRLRKAGIKLGDDDTAMPFLYFSLNVMRSQNIYVYDVDVSFRQAVTVLSVGRIMLADTWSVDTVGLVGRLNMARGIRDLVGDMVDRFLNAYLSMNPLTQ